VRNSGGGVYLDPSALVKLIALEDESAALRMVVQGLSPCITCELSLAEVPRALRRRQEAAALGEALAVVFDVFEFVPIDRSLLQAAGALASSVRTLDAIHVVAALTVSADLEAFVTYDARQADAARVYDLPVVSPGRA
jgi:predicted nucleic acid-binding protein